MVIDGGVAVTDFRQLHEHGNYTLDLTNGTTGSIIIPLANDKADFTPIWATFITLIGAQMIYCG